MKVGGCRYPGLSGDSEELLKFEVALVGCAQLITRYAACFTRSSAAISRVSLRIIIFLKSCDCGLFQIEMQMAVEKAFLDIAASTRKPTILFHDRGLMDVSAYLPKVVWKHVLQARGWTEEMFLKRCTHHAAYVLCCRRPDS